MVEATGLDANVAINFRVPISMPMPCPWDDWALELDDCVACKSCRQEQSPLARRAYTANAVVEDGTCFAMPREFSFAVMAMSFWPDCDGPP
jgi:hypothetical protein